MSLFLISILTNYIGTFWAASCSFSKILANKKAIQSNAHHPLGTTHASVSLATTRRCSQEIGPQMSKFELVSSDHHQISLAGGRYPGELSHDALDATYPHPWTDRHL